MKIGDEVFVHGYVDEIRKDCIIISNDGGYFGTVPTEIVENDGEEYKRGRLDALSELKAYIREMGTYDTADTPQTERSACDTCQWYNSGIPCGVEPSVCKREVADTPQTDLLVKIPQKSRESHEIDTPQTKYPTEWCENCELWRENNCMGVAQCKQNIKALKELSDLYEADTPQTDCGWGEKCE